MKILFSCLSQSWGGMEMVTLTGIKQLLKYNIQVQLLCAEESRLQLEANNIGIIIYPIKVSSYLTFFNIIKLSTIIRREKYDLIHSHASKDLWLIVPALKLIKSKIPLLLTKHIGSFIVKKDIFHNWIYSKVTNAIAISSVIKNNLTQTTALTADRINVIFNGVDLTRFNTQNYSREKFRKELNVSDDQILIGMIARFSPGKGHEEFIKAARILNSKFNNLKFLIVGEASRGEDRYESEIKKLAESLKLDNIIFTGFRSDIPEILFSMDIFVFPSHAEAFGIALIEAMSMERSSVCSNTDGILDIALNNETSLLFNNKDASDLALKTETLILDKDLRKRLGQNSRRRVNEVFDIEKVTQQTINLYNKLLKEVK